MSGTQAPPEVTYNPDRSTLYTQVYDAQSRSQPGQVWRVTYDARTDRWRCPCPARGECAHIVAARREGWAREWRAIWAGQTDAALRRADCDWTARLAEAGAFGEEETLAYDLLGEELAARIDRRAA